MPKLVIYTGEHCPNCKLLKQYLADRGVEYTEKSVTEVANLKYLQDHYVSKVPATVVDGEIYVGFDKAKYGELLESLSK